MQSLTMEPTYRVVLGDVRHFRILQVGCGGTGSALALALGALAYHAKQKGTRVELTLLDHDVIEERNVGRQSFAVAGNVRSARFPKCADLALRLNAAYGLDVAAWPVQYTWEVGERWLSGCTARGRQVQLLIDCVDNAAARREMGRTLAAHDSRLWQISCGNERVNGQVLLGNTDRPEQIQFDGLGLCTGLPYPYVQEPELLAEDKTEVVVSCALMAQQQAQSLMINRLAATVAGQLVTEMVLEQQVTQMGVYFSLSPPAMRARLLTEGAVSRQN